MGYLKNNPSFATNDTKVIDGADGGLRKREAAKKRRGLENKRK
jgi:hypothetical protein